MVGALDHYFRHDFHYQFLRHCLLRWPRHPEHLVLALVEIRTFQQKIIAFTPVPFQLMPMLQHTHPLTTRRSRPYPSAQGELVG